MKAEVETQPTKTSRISSLVYLLLLIIGTLILLYFRLKIQIHRGPAFDTFSFLDNALHMAGKIKYFEIDRPPLLSFLCSIFFRLGLTSELVIYLLDSLFLLSGIIGFYLILRIRFTPTQSFIGSALLLSFPVMVANATLGMTDIAAISLSIWTIYFTVIASEKDRRLFLVALPFLVLTFLTRFTAALMIFPVLFYMLLRGNVLKNFGNIIKGVALGATILVADLIFASSVTKGEPLLQFGAPYETVTVVVPSGLKSAKAAALSPFYFVTNLPKFLGRPKITYLFTILVLVGLLATVVQLIRARQENISVIALLVPVGLGILMGYMLFSKINFLLVATAILVYFLLVVPGFFKIERNLSFDLLFLIWLLVFLNFHSYLQVKEPRYFVTMAPGIAYLATLGLSFLIGGIQRIFAKGDLHKAVSVLAYATLALLIGLSTYQSYQGFLRTPEWKLFGIEKGVSWIRQQLTHRNYTIFTDYQGPMIWYLKRDLNVMPLFTTAGVMAVDHELSKYEADYFVTPAYILDYPSYIPFKSFEKVHLYKRRNNKLPEKLQIFLIGKDIDRYLEEILDFKVYLFRKKPPIYGDKGSSVSTTFIDDYSLNKLKKYRTLLLYDFRWHDKTKAEKLLQDFLSSGGTIIIDASGNSGKSFYDLNNVDFLGVSVLKQELPVSPRISVTSDFNLKSGVDAGKFARFVDEDGEPWFGSTYEKAPTSQGKFKTLVTADGNTLVSLEQRGRGRIIWIGYNFIFHAFYHKNRAEKQLIQNVFRLAAK